MNISVREWFKSGSPWVWMNAGAVAICMIMVIGLLGLIAIRGLSHFWPADIIQGQYTQDGETVLVGEIVETNEVLTKQLIEAGIKIPTTDEFSTRYLIKIGNRDVNGSDFTWALEHYLSDRQTPEMLFNAERREWGNLYGYLRSVKQSGEEVGRYDGYDKSAEYLALWDDLELRIERALDIREDILEIEKHEIGEINHELERLRLKERSLQLKDLTDPALYETINQRRKELDTAYQGLQQRLLDLYAEINRDSITAEVATGQQVEIQISKIVRAFRPNDMGILQKTGHYFAKLWEFVSEDPREANTEGGIFPAIFGTVMMVILMSILVTPFGVVAAVYLREYAKQGFITRVIRIAVNNLAGVPSIVYGVFGLGFFVYFLGGNIDDLFFPEAKPAPTFGTPGLMWASLTLALLTVPVVIVATEEGLSRIPRSVREGSLALGATKFETLMKVVLPMASPAMMTGVILAIARAAGEVAPLMLVGVVKLAPSLPLDGNYPFIHLDQKFMHLGFHIYDVGFQSPNVEAARPLVYATAMLLVIVIALLNLSAIAIRNHLREKYKALEM
ncbi:phosphate ABC transporter permease PstA [Amphritea balenae]|uniref:Phosphate transport system permease protein PstA n=1 Tax=Amphritea balenae TaxID=452629 RepID=A0A3P1SNS3_9GAMM|nr:phosphate ABC transporter permease PstA [Amphritea balenae]RRC98793.1 phosphate ABC transporter permease PstA [Amphritea balenae]GGK61734.1 phosphate transport system permease protein PstA [Amphritea balenae]